MNMFCVNKIKTISLVIKVLFWNFTTLLITEKSC